MNAKKIVLASISYVLITMAIAYPWHMVWFHDLYEEMGAYTRPEPSIPLGMLSMLVQGVVIAYLYPIFYRGGNPVIQGIKFSIIIGTVVYSVMGFAMAAKIDINPISTYLLYNLIFQFIQFISTGAVLGLIYGKVNQKNITKCSSGRTKAFMCCKNQRSILSTDRMLSVEACQNCSLIQ